MQKPGGRTERMEKPGGLAEREEPAEVIMISGNVENLKL
nr:hypothetical protein Iba_chr04eCG12080 [Ipomoea batatas]